MATLTISHYIKLYSIGSRVSVFILDTTEFHLIYILFKGLLTFLILLLLSLHFFFDNGNVNSTIGMIIFSR